jgi:predicted RNase H-like nuclease (RuvC/YqgF family)
MGKNTQEMDVKLSKKSEELELFKIRYKQDINNLDLEINELKRKLEKKSEEHEDLMKLQKSLEVKLMGHVNSKQKIQHLKKVKEENNELRKVTIIHLLS